MLLALAVGIGLGAVLWVLLGRGEDGTSITALAPGDCFSPAREILAAEVDDKSCGDDHEGELVAVVVHPGGPEDDFPGPDSLALYGEAACSAPAEERSGRSSAALLAAGITLRIAAPVGAEWEAGERRLACSYVASTGVLDAPVSN